MKSYSILNNFVDKIIESIIYFIILFSVWAFGATESWSNEILFKGILLLSIMTFVSVMLNLFNKNSIYRANNIKFSRLHKYSNFFIMLISALIIVYIYVCYLNARSDYDLSTNTILYYDDYQEIFPTTYNKTGTGFLLIQYISLFFLFYSIKYWVNKNSSEPTKISIRTKKILFFLILNGALVSLISILQRIYYGGYEGKLLFLIEPTINKGNISQFGPFAYRSNASTYFNLIWPIGIGLFIQINKENIEKGMKRIGSGKEILIIPSIILITIGPVVSLARGGTLIMIFICSIIAIMLLFLNLRSIFSKLIIPVAILIALSVIYIFAWEKIDARLENTFADNLSNRINIYNVTIDMINEYGIYGSGPGSFEAIAIFELNDQFNQWESWAHSDFLEIILTFGKIGSSLILLFILSIFFKLALNAFTDFAFFNTLIIMSFIGLLVHSAFDFPLQTYLILLNSTIILASVMEINKSTYLRR